MEDRISGAIEQHFGNLEDPRVDRTKLHKLMDILVIAICAVIAGADNWEDMEEFGKVRLDWLKTFLELPNGIPSYDTFNRVFARLDPEQFQASFVSWMRAVSQILGGQVIAIDGKVVRRSHDHGIGKAAIDIVSAWATANHLVLGQVKVDEKSNEITAIPQLLEALEVAGCIVTMFHLTRIIYITRCASFSSTLTTKRDRRKNVAAKQTLEYGGLYHGYYHFYNPCPLRGGRFYEGQTVASARAGPRP
jgi:predicted transposase YbfD/YdcC